MQIILTCFSNGPCVNGTILAKHLLGFFLIPNTDVLKKKAVIVESVALPGNEMFPHHTVKQHHAFPSILWHKTVFHDT